MDAGWFPNQSKTNTGSNPVLTTLIKLNLREMKQLENKLKELQKYRYENVGINQVLQWIAEIKRENRVKRVRSTDR